MHAKIFFSVPVRILLLIVCSACFAVTACQTSSAVDVIQEDTAFAHRAVIKLLDTMVDDVRLKTLPQMWKNQDQSLLFPENSESIIATRDKIPQLRLYLDAYLHTAYSVVSNVYEDTVEYLALLVDNTKIEDPYDIIQGRPYAATALFFSQHAESIRSFVQSSIQSTSGQLLSSWLAVESRYDMYTKATNNLSTLLEPEDTGFSSIDPIPTIVETLFKEMQRMMETEETIIRATANAYDSPELRLFAPSGRQ